MPVPAGIRASVRSTTVICVTLKSFNIEQIDRALTDKAPNDAAAVFPYEGRGAATVGKRWDRV